MYKRQGQASPGDLIDHILARYHEVHRQQLPELIRLAMKVEQVHADSPDCPTGLADHLRDMRQELESHMQKEEQVLFPMLARGHGAMAVMPITMMRMEHDDLSLIHISAPRPAPATRRRAGRRAD